MAVSGTAGALGHPKHPPGSMVFIRRTGRGSRRGSLSTTEQGTGGAQRKWDAGGQGSCQAGFTGAAEVRREGGWLPEQGGSTEGPVWEQCLRTREAKAGDMRGPGCWEPDCCGRERGDVPPGGARGMRRDGSSICVCVSPCVHTHVDILCMPLHV